jgi:hypothetical protein
MQNPPRELVKQVEYFNQIINSLNVLTDANKINVKNYGSDFLQPLIDIRQKAMELRSLLEVFKSNLDYSLGAQFEVKNKRFAAVEKVVKNYLEPRDEK